MNGADLGVVAYEEWGQYGVPVFPCTAEKRPLHKKWGQVASTDRDEILTLFAQAGTRGVMIGGVMGERAGLFAIDFDLYKNKDAANFKRVLETTGLLPDTRVHKTKSGGLHYIYSVESGPIPRNSVPADGVEIRGEGGYIILPPSPGYEVIRGGAVDAPEGLLRRLRENDAAFKQLGTSALVDKIIKGESFHEALVMISAKMHGRGEDPAKIMETMQSAMMGSVARNPMHKRHDRWKAIMEGEDGELARIAGSAYKKFNSRSNEADAENLPSETGVVSMEDEQRNRAVTGAGFFAPPTAFKGTSHDNHGSFDAGKSDEQEAATEDDDFPFSKAYTAAKVDEEENKRYLVYPLIMESDVIVLSAEPKAGKTLMTMNLCLHAAAGIPVGDMLPLTASGDVGKIPVLYFALEGQGAIRKRVKAWLEYQRTVHGRTMTEEDLHIYIVENAVNLSQKEDQQKLVDKIVLANQYFINKGWGKIGIMVFDTFTKTMPGKDQNSVEDTSSVFNTVSMLREVGVDPAVMFIHHNSKNSKMPRGSSNILAEPDTVLSVQKKEQIVQDGMAFDTYQLSVFVARSIDDTQSYTMKAHSVSIGKNSQGIPETAPVLEYIEDYAAARTVPEGTISKSALAAKGDFYTWLYDILTGTENMAMSINRLHKALTATNKSAAVYYSQFVNSQTADGVLSAWKVLTDANQIPDEYAGIVYDIDDGKVVMRIDEQAAAAM